MRAHPNPNRNPDPDPDPDPNPNPDPDPNTNSLTLNLTMTLTLPLTLTLGGTYCQMTDFDLVQLEVISDDSPLGPSGLLSRVLSLPR